MAPLESLFVAGTEACRQGTDSVWELQARRGRTGAAQRLELVLSLLNEAAAAVLVCEDDPAVLAGQPPGWVAIGEGAWRLPDEPLDLGELLDWLADGNWQLVGFVAASAVAAPGVLDLFGQPESALARLRAMEASWAVDVFHDDEPWRVALVHRGGPATPVGHLSAG